MRRGILFSSGRVIESDLYVLCDTILEQERPTKITICIKIWKAVREMKGADYLLFMVVGFCLFVFQINDLANLSLLPKINATIKTQCGVRIVLICSNYSSLICAHYWSHYIKYFRTGCECRLEKGAEQVKDYRNQWLSVWNTRGKIEYKEHPL